MPNDCWNHFTITGNKEDIKRFLEDELKEPPEWALKIHHKGDEGLSFRLWSRWQPDFNWLESLLTKYPSLWVKNVWDEEGGYEGVWIGYLKDGKAEIKHMEWMGMCIEEWAHRFRKDPPKVPVSFKSYKKNGVMNYSSDDIWQVFRFQKDFKKSEQWSFEIEGTPIKSYYDFPDLDDPELIKRFGLD
jgi:hypothetical protein